MFSKALYSLSLQDMVAGFACDCPAGYTGVTCLDDINECLEANCPGNSTCVEDALDSFLCQCNSGFEGENCTGEQKCCMDHKIRFL